MSEESRRVLHPTGASIDPVAMARRDLKRGLPRRFYRNVAVAETANGFGIALDGKPVQTPAKASFVLPTRDLAKAITAEWAAQTDLVEPDTMPLTRLVNSAIDGVADHLEATIAEVVKFGETDLVCYRAAEPDALVEAQAAAWDPILTFARVSLGTRFVCAQGILHVAQSPSALAAVRVAVETIAAAPTGTFRLAALSVMTSLTGSVLIALAVARGALGHTAAWAAANVDEDYQMLLWGADEHALTRRAYRGRDMQAASTLYRLCENGGR